MRIVIVPMPPLDLRVQVGPTEDAFFDNPSGQPIFDHLPVEVYESVFDWGCGCGRLARQLIQQQPQPGRYVGVDLNIPSLWGHIAGSGGLNAPDAQFIEAEIKALLTS